MIVSTGMFTEYCCRLVLASEWEKTAHVLDKAIKSKSYEEGVSYIESIDISCDKKDRLKRCLLSHKESC